MKRFIHNSLSRVGWELRRFSPDTSEWARLVRQLAVHEINVVLDVGANLGQFARKLRDSGFHGRIVSFEALETVHSKLQDQSRRDKQWIVAPRVAVGDHDGETLINIAGNSVSSSVLPMLAAHLDAEPQSRYVSVEQVDLRKLDTIAGDYLSKGDRVFLKVDVQGFEYQVLQGATRLLDGIVGIQMEMSLVPLYDGELLFDQLLHELGARGFELWSLLPAFVDRKTGRLLQVDGVFFRPSSLSYAAST
jgi:FkbM family methyltransferase